MKTTMTILGSGAVTPAGIGVSALFGAGPEPLETASLGDPKARHPVFRVDLKEAAFRRWEREPRLRRASPISLFLIEAAEQALAGLSSSERAETGLIVAFSSGCLAYSRRFYQGIASGGRKAANPALFPDTVFNSPASHVAATLGLGLAPGAGVYALVGDETAWIAALQTASVWLRQGEASRVLVLGAEEFDPIFLDACRMAGELRSHHLGCFVPSEGAAGLLVGLGSSGNGPAVMETRDGFVYRSAKEGAAAAERCLCDFDPALPCHRSAGRNRLGRLEARLTADRPWLSSSALPYLGEAFAASAAWNTLRALSSLTPETARILVPVWGQNHQIGALVLGTQSERIKIPITTNAPHYIHTLPYSKNIIHEIRRKAFMCSESSLVMSS